MTFRAEALEARQSSDVLDLPVRLTSPRGWIVVLLIAAAVIGGAFWAFTGSLPRAVIASGLLTSADGSFAIQTIAAGQVTQVLVTENAVVQRNAPVAWIFDGARSELVRSPSAGRVFSVRVRVGQVLAVGGTVAVAERDDPAGPQLVAAVYLRAPEVSSVRDGVLVRLQVASAGQYGVLLGKVQSVQTAPATPEDIAAFLGDDELGGVLAARGARYRVVVALDKSGTTTSGYEWSRRDGPPFKVHSRTTVVASIEQPSVRPADWILPS